MKNLFFSLVILVLVLPAAGRHLLAEETSPADDGGIINEFDLGGNFNMTVHGDLWLYHIRTINTYHTSSSAGFTEMTSRLGADFKYRDNLSAQIRLVGMSVHQRPANWIGYDLTGFDDSRSRFDLANIKIEGNLGRQPTSLTVGLQELSFGDGLLIYDGYSEKRTIWTTPVRSFPAVKWSIGFDENSGIDIFTAYVHEDRVSWEAYLGSGAGMEGGGSLSGFNIHSDKGSPLGETDLGVFYKSERVDRADNFGMRSNSDTLAVSLRGSRSFNDFLVTAEVVRQMGETNVIRNTITNNNHGRRAWGGHITVKYDLPDSLYTQLRYARFSGDSGSTRTVESFDPFFSGFVDWGSWDLGDMTSNSLTNTNKRVISLEFGFEPTEKTKARAILYNFSLDRTMPFSTSKNWSNEINIVFDYYPTDHFFFGAMVGAVVPGNAAKDFYSTPANRNNKTQSEVMAWAGFSF